MTVKYLSSETERIVDQTVSGLDICFTLIGKTDTSFDNGSKNEYLSLAQKFLDPSNVHIKITLKRGGKDNLLVSDNLALLGKFATITQGRDLWEEGVKLGTREMLHSVYIPFSGNTNWDNVINVKNGDVLEVYVNVVKGTYGSELDANACICEVRSAPAIGIEAMTPYISTYSVRANQQSDLVQAGNNVTRIALISMSNDNSNIPNSFTDVSVTSDKWDNNFNSNQLILQHSKFIEDKARTHADTVDSYLLHENTELDQCKIGLKMNPVHIRENTVYVVYSHFESSLELLQKAQVMTDKHESKDIAKLPVTLNP